MNKVLAYLLLAVVVSLSGCGSASNPQAETAAVTAAKTWLALVDGETVESDPSPQVEGKFVLP